ncbi:ABC transporter permease [Nakamurella antarctica]|uniref:ABC transporter permease n=2 Tax=Nakamurella antarctica TaxID=1902245 RepID=A0A3G8ZZ35_9ACTN|nr:ABC transporter permease [Nakamurella antarctica]
MLLASDNSTPWGYFGNNSDQVLGYFWEHLWLSVLPVVLGLIIAMPIGYLARRVKWTYTPLVTVSGLLYTIPSIALFVLAPQILGTKILSPVNVVIPLTLYTVALMVRVIADGLAAVPEHVLQSASAMGYNRFERLLKVELPIAVPVISAGLRVAVVGNVGMVAVAITIGVQQLGTLFITGFQKQAFGQGPIVLGIILSVVLALFLDSLLVLGTKVLTPWRKAVSAT